MWFGQTQIKRFMCRNTVDEQVIPSWGTLLSHVWSGLRGLVTCWRFCSPKKRTKMWLFSFGLPDLCHLLNLWPQPIILLSPPPNPSPASALVDNTPSIWRWRTTYVCMVKYQGRIDQNTSVLFFCLVFHFSITGCPFFTLSIKAVLRGEGQDSWTRIRVWHFSYRAKANLTKNTHACKHLPTPDLVRHAWDTKGVNSSSSFKKHTKSDQLVKETMTNHKKAGTGNGSGCDMKKKTKSEALQASFKACNWQSWVRQLGFSNGSLWHSSSPPFFLSCCPSLTALVCVCPVAHTWTGSVWFICSLMSWMLPRIFFWWPASVTPIRSKSLWRQKKVGENENRWPHYKK